MTEEEIRADERSTFTLIPTKEKGWLIYVKIEGSDVVAGRLVKHDMGWWIYHVSDALYGTVSDFALETLLRFVEEFTREMLSLVKTIGKKEGE